MFLEVIFDFRVEEFIGVNEFWDGRGYFGNEIRIVKDLFCERGGRVFWVLGVISK